MYGDSHGSPGQDSHFGPSYPPVGEPAGPYGAARPDGGAPHAAAPGIGLPPTDVQVAGPPMDTRTDPAGTAYAPLSPGDWSREQAGDEDPYHPVRSSSGDGMSLKVAVVAVAAAVMVGGGAIAAGALTQGSGAKPKSVSAPGPSPTATPSGLIDQAADNANIQAADANARKLIQNRASEAARKAATKAPPLAPKGIATPSASPSPSASATTGGGHDPMPAGAAQAYAQSLMGGYGWTSGGQFGCLVKLWDRESHWNVHAANPSGAYGIPQALPGSKMGPGWQDDAKVQIRWGLGYIRDRYSTPCGAWAHSEATGWY